VSNIPLEIHSDFSIQESFIKIPELVFFAYDNKVPYLCLTDTHNVSGAVEFLQEIEKYNKKGEHKIVPVIGTKLNILTNGEICKLTVLAKNKTGYLEILKLLGNSYRTEKEVLVVEPQHLEQCNNLLVVTPKSIPVTEKYAACDRFPNIKNPHFPVYYLEANDDIFHHMILCSKHKVTLQDVKNDNSLIGDDEPYFSNTELYFPVESEYVVPKELLEVETYSLAQQPNIPIFTSAPDDVLIQLCRDGWKNKNINTVCKSEEIKTAYVNRVKEELNVLTTYGLSNYMLIVRDIMELCHKHNVKVGLRGSAVGCLVSYLTDISDLDPMMPDPTLPYDPAKELLFSRFMNEGRLSKDRVSLPDCDIDVEPWFRETIFEYLKNKYGRKNAGQIITFLRMDGRAAIKEVFRILQPAANSVKVAEDITRNMIDLARVQDIVADIQEDDPDYTIIHYNIDNVPKVKEYYHEYKDVFDKAIRLTNLIRSTGKHAAGIIIGNTELENFLPVTYDKESGDLIVAFEMLDAEYAGAVKFDILGVSAYEKITQMIGMINDNRTTIKL
jgi:DNA polymerase-3 subunit alpha